ncbi:MAG: hypothetical protein ACI9OJ_002359 [Myxococcota bacterium]
MRLDTAKQSASNPELLRGLVPNRTLALVLLSACLSGCAPSFIAEHAIPTPTVSMPYGLVAVDVEIGKTQDAVLWVTADGFVDRVVRIAGDGVIVLRVNRGEWRIQVKGTDAAKEVVTFGGKTSKTTTTGGGQKVWPPTPVQVLVKKRFITNGGRICAHSECKAPWSEYDDPAFDAWRNQERLLESVGPAPEAAESVPDESKTDP